MHGIPSDHSADVQRPKGPKYRASHMLRAHKPHALSHVLLFLHVPVVATLQLLLASSHSVEMV